jgi:hypothetical protein
MNTNWWLPATACPLLLQLHSTNGDCLLHHLPKGTLYHGNMGHTQHHVHKNLLPVRPSMCNQKFSAVQTVPCHWIQTLSCNLAALTVCRQDKTVYRVRFREDNHWLFFIQWNTVQRWQICKLTGPYLHINITLRSSLEHFSIQLTLGEINVTAYLDLQLKLKLIQNIFMFCRQVLLRISHITFHQNIMVAGNSKTQYPTQGVQHTCIFGVRRKPA